MIDIAALQARIIDGLHPYVEPYGVTAIIERDQDAPKPPYPFIGLKWLTLIPEIGMDRRTREIVPSDVRGSNMTSSIDTSARPGQRLV